MHITRPVIVIVCLMMTGCVSKTVGYSATGAAAGAGIGYSYHKDAKEAAIGGLAGGALGAVVGGVTEHLEKKSNKAAYDKGYNQAQVDVAVQNWDENTGKNAYLKKSEVKHLTAFKVSEKKQDDVVYDSHYVILEDYR